MVLELLQIKYHVFKVGANQLHHIGLALAQFQIVAAGGKVLIAVGVLRIGQPVHVFGQVHLLHAGTGDDDQGAVEKRVGVSNVIKLAAKEEAAEGHRIPKEIQKELIRKKRQQKQTEAAPSEKGYRKGQRAEA